MPTLHEKCPECGGRIYRIGGRRRRCRRCRKSWSVWTRRRGPKPRRASIVLARRVLLERDRVRNLTRYYHCSPSALRRRLRHEIGLLVGQPAAVAIPEANLVLLIDGMWSTFRDAPWVLYNMAVKPIDANVAYFLKPYLRGERETVKGWREAIATLPDAIRQRIRALVSDDLPWLTTLAHDCGWVHQLCHYHLILALELKMGWARPRLPTRWLRDEIYQLIREALTATDEPRLVRISERLRYLAQRWDCRRRLRWIVNQFLRQMDQYRAYLRHPELNLPTTTSAMESMHSLLRPAVGTVNTPQALLRRATAFLTLHPTITCNSRILTQK